jgi:hypothetical protein
MASFGVEIQESPELLDFVIQTNKKLNSEHIVKNPFNGRLQVYQDMLVVNMDPIYLNITPYIALFLGVGIFFIFGVSWLLLIPLAFLFLGFFWSQYFLYIMLFLGLKKYGYKNRCKLLASQETIKRLIFNGTTRNTTVSTRPESNGSRLDDRSSNQEGVKRERALNQKHT